MKTSPLAFLAFTAAALSTAAQAAAASNPSTADKTFVHKVGMGGMYEVVASQVAQAQGTSQNVKDFSANEVKDHDQVNDELKSIATAQGLTVPAELDASHQKLVDGLKSKSGASFDVAYLKAMAKVHDMDEALFVKEAKTSQDPELKAFAAKTADIVEGHIKMLQGYSSKP